MHAAAHCMHRNACNAHWTRGLRAGMSWLHLYLDSAQDEGPQRCLSLISHVRPDWPLRWLCRSVCLRLLCRRLLLLLLNLLGLCLGWLRMLQQRSGLLF
jgi:hypothetical protein